MTRQIRRVTYMTRAFRQLKRRVTYMTRTFHHPKRRVTS